LKYLLNFKKSILAVMMLLATLPPLIAFTEKRQPNEASIISYSVDPKKQDLQLFWKNDKGEVLKNFQNLKSYVERKNKKLLFAMNGGMYKQGGVPQGLYIEQSKTLSPLDTMSGDGNFYLKPNGIFYITADHIAVVCQTSDFKPDKNISYATQSGPMLVNDGSIHSAFKEGSKNLNIRNGVGILPDGRILFAISEKEINFYDFALYFKKQGCKNALYLDGFVSRMYLPEKNRMQTDGNFGVMIGVTSK
jgi:uncharacterized protein YigE (DUF2233 family)